MSGGHWNYSAESYREAGRRANDAFQLLAQCEHELDWGISADTCLDCAKLRVAGALIKFFDGDIEAALAIARDRQQNRCPRCEERA